MKEVVKKYIDSDSKHLHDIKLFFETHKLSLCKAIEIAAKLIDPTNNNKMFSHQRRVGYKITNEGYKILKFKEEEFNSSKNFEDIMFITNNVMKQIPRLGPLWSYDTALRIGFNLKIYPTNVYLQTGVIKGYKKIFNGTRPRKRCVEKLIFPQELQVLEAYEIENFLCIWGSN